jgi:putative endonuclease
MSLRGGHLFFPREATSCSLGGCFGKTKYASQRHIKQELFEMAVGREYCIYLMTNAHNTVVYCGVTNNLARRVYEHKNGLGGIFTKKYNISKLVYYEVGDNVHAALAREKQIKGGSRKKKMDLVNSVNPEWKDLFDEIT